METWDNISHQTETSLRFASSQPAACRVGLEDGPRPVDLPKHASLNETLSTETIPNCVIDLEADNRARAMATVQAAIKARGIPELPRSYELPRGCRLPIRAQGLCSSSWAMAAIGAFEKQICVHTGHRQRLAVAKVLQCAELGCRGGRPEAAHRILFERGVPA